MSKWMSRPLKPVMVAALGAALLAPSLSTPSLAATGYGGNGPNRYALLTAMSRVPAIRLTAASPILHTLRVPATVPGAVSRTISDPNALKFQPPAGATNIQEQAVDKTWADDPKQNLFQVFDDQSYASNNMQGGYAEAFDLPIGTAGGIVTVFWLGSYYPSSTDVTNRITETVKAVTANGAQDTACGTGCHLFAFPLKDSSGQAEILEYTIFSVDNAMGELAFVVHTADFQANQTAYGNIVQSVANGALQALSGQGTGTTTTGAITVQIGAFKLYHKVKGKLKLTKSLKSGEAGTFAALVQFQNLGTTTPTATITFKSGSKTLSTVTLQNAGTQADGSVLFGVNKKFKAKKKPLHIVAILTAQAGQGQAAQTLRFKVKKKK